MKKLILLLIFMGFSLLSLNTIASDSNESDRDVQRVLEECGIGGLIFGRSNPIFAIISNVTWDLGTTATSNSMSPESCITPEAENAAFIHNSYKEIVTDAAKGQGVYLDTLAQISNRNTQDIRSIINSLI